jgi:hypothetical protein
VAHNYKEIRDHLQNYETFEETLTDLSAGKEQVF